MPVNNLEYIVPLKKHMLKNKIGVRTPLKKQKPVQPKHKPNINIRKRRFNQIRRRQQQLRRKKNQLRKRR